MLGSVEGAGDGVGDVGERDAAVGVVGCAGVPGEFAVVGDVEGASVGLAGIGGGEKEAGVAAGVGDGGGEAVAIQGVADDLDEGVGRDAAGTRYLRPVELVNQSAGDRTRARSAIVLCVCCFWAGFLGALRLGD